MYVLLPVTELSKKRQHKSHAVLYRTKSAKEIVEMVLGIIQFLSGERKKRKKKKKDSAF